ncbi:MAG: ATP-binding protein [Pseudomonadota bacterium]
MPGNWRPDGQVLKAWLNARNRGLFIRSYIALAGGLLIVAVLLDAGFSALQSHGERAADPWLISTFRLAESELGAAPPAERSAIAAKIAQRLGLEVDLLDAGDIAGAKATEPGPRELTDDAGNVYFLYQSAALQGSIRMGPFNPPPESALNRFLPIIFYASILLIVGLWLRPLLRDLTVLTSASQKFASDYREPLDTATRTTQLTSLATNLDDMSARVSQLIQTQKEMTAALSHEIRTPLARVRFAAAVLEGEVDEELRGQLRAINSDVQQIDDLISDMLDYARLDHPGLRMQFQNVPLEPWLAAIVAAAPPHERSVDTVRRDDLDNAWMEPRLMELALSNLLANALRYSRGTVSISIARDENLYRLAVEDDGEGIPDGDRTSIFRAFTRLDTSRNRDTGGFGLGLAIVARIAALHRGRVVAGTSTTLGGAKLALEWPLPAKT